MARLSLSRSGMMRITRTRSSDGSTLLRIEGRIAAGAPVGELEKVAEDALSQGAARVSLDLSAVTFADDAGTALLRRLIRGGVRVLTSSALLSELLRGEECP